jgi:hypothetical protein
MVPPPLVRCFKPPIAKSCWLQRPIHLQAYPSRTQQRPPSPRVVQDTPTNNCDWSKFNSAKLQDDRNLHFLLYPPIPNRRAYKRCRPSKLSPQIRDTAIHISTTRALCRRVRLAACVLCCGIRGIHQTGISRVAAPQTRLRPRHPI